MGQKRAKRRRRERKQEKRAALPLEQRTRRKKREPVIAGPVAVATPTKRRPPSDSPGDQIALQLRTDDGEDEGGAAVREPRRPKRPPSLAGAAALPEPPAEADTEAVAR